jgi:hypothetical protein
MRGRGFELGDEGVDRGQVLRVGGDEQAVRPRIGHDQRHLRPGELAGQVGVAALHDGVDRLDDAVEAGLLDGDHLDERIVVVEGLVEIGGEALDDGERLVAGRDDERVGALIGHDGGAFEVGGFRLHARRRSSRASIISWMRRASRVAEACSSSMRRISRRSGAISASSDFSSCSITAKLRGLVVTMSALVRSSAWAMTRSSGRMAFDCACWSKRRVTMLAKRVAEACSTG